MKTVSSSGNIVRLSCACSNSDSKSETALNPLTMARAPCSRRSPRADRPSARSRRSRSRAVTFSISRAARRRAAGPLLAHVAAHGHHDVVEYPARPPDDVEVARGNGVEATGTNSHYHRDLRPLKYRHVRATIAARDPFLDCALSPELRRSRSRSGLRARAENQAGVSIAPDLRRRDSIRRVQEDQIELSPRLRASEHNTGPTLPRSPPPDPGTGSCAGFPGSPRPACPSRRTRPSRTRGSELSIPSAPVPA